MSGTVCESCQLAFDEFVFVLLPCSKLCGVYRIKRAQSELISTAAEQLCHISRCPVLMEYFSHPLLQFFSPLPLQTNQYPHSLAFHRKDYREMAIKGLASITSTISKPLKDSGSLGLGSWTCWPRHTAEVLREPKDPTDFIHCVCLCPQPTLTRHSQRKQMKPTRGRKETLQK